MEDRSNITCRHSEYSLEELKKNPFIFLNELVDHDDFPIFQPGICSEKCKEKMKFIINFTFGRLTKVLNCYFEDSKIIFDRENKDYCTPWVYHGNLLINSAEELCPEYVTYMNIGPVDGKVVRLCDNTNEFSKEIIEEKIKEFLNKEL